MPNIEIKNRVLYIRLHSTITDKSIIRSLHPKIKHVRLPRKKASRFCLVKFKDEVTCLEVKNDLENKTYEGKKIVARFGIKKSVKCLTESTLLIANNISTNTKRRDIKKAIPSVSKIYIKRMKKKQKGNYAVLVFESLMAAESVLRKGVVEIKGVQVKLEKFDVSSSMKKLYVNEKTESISTEKNSNSSVRYFDIASNDLSSVEGSDMESVDLEYKGNFDSDSD